MRPAEGIEPSAALREILEAARVLPILTVDRPAEAVSVTRALAQGGLRAVEITLRREGALRAIEAVARELPEIAVGAGTVVAGDQFRLAAQAGARFAVSPGFTPELAAAAARSAIPWLPGVATASEAMAARAAGYRLLKLFPARELGGPAFLEAIRKPLADLMFCPTGGIDGATYRAYLDLPNVLCVGGSWMVPAAAVAAGDWPAVTREARGVTR